MQSTAHSFGVVFAVYAHKICFYLLAVCVDDNDKWLWPRALAWNNMCDSRFWLHLFLFYFWCPHIYSSSAHYRRIMDAWFDVEHIVFMCGWLHEFDGVTSVLW